MRVYVSIVMTATIDGELRSLSSFTKMRHGRRSFVVSQRDTRTRKNEVSDVYSSQYWRLECTDTVNQLKIKKNGT